MQSYSVLPTLFQRPFLGVLTAKNRVAAGPRSGGGFEFRRALPLPIHLFKYFTTASVRLCAPSFSNIFFKWPWTVHVLIRRKSAISLSGCPLLSSPRISCSRGVKFDNSFAEP